MFILATQFRSLKNSRPEGDWGKSLGTAWIEPSQGYLLAVCRDMLRTQCSGIDPLMVWELVGRGACLLFWSQCFLP